MTDDELETQRGWIRHEVRQARRRDRLVLTSWGLAVIILACLFSWWVWRNQEHAAAERDALKLQQDRAMCAMIDNVFLSGPEPVAGPAGDRSRSVRAGLMVYRTTLRCDQIEP